MISSSQTSVSLFGVESIDASFGTNGCSRIFSISVYTPMSCRLRKGGFNPVHFPCQFPPILSTLQYRSELSPLTSSSYRGGAGTELDSGIRDVALMMKDMSPIWSKRK